VDADQPARDAACGWCVRWRALAVPTGGRVKSSRHQRPIRCRCRTSGRNRRRMCAPSGRPPAEAVEVTHANLAAFARDDAAPGVGEDDVVLALARCRSMPRWDRSGHAGGRRPVVVVDRDPPSTATRSRSPDRPDEGNGAAWRPTTCGCWWRRTGGGRRLLVRSARQRRRGLDRFPAPTAASSAEAEPRRVPRLAQSWMGAVVEGVVTHRSPTAPVVLDVDLVVRPARLVQRARPDEVRRGDAHAAASACECLMQSTLGYQGPALQRGGGAARALESRARHRGGCGADRVRGADRPFITVNAGRPPDF